MSVVRIGPTMFKVAPLGKHELKGATPRRTKEAFLKGVGESFTARR